MNTQIYTRVDIQLKQSHTAQEDGTVVTQQAFMFDPSLQVGAFVLMLL